MRWKAQSLADELAEIHAGHVKRRNGRDRIADRRPDASDQFDAAVALLAAERSRNAPELT